MRFNPPPAWPKPPPGWRPPPGWLPDPSWEPAPDGWQFWIPDSHTAAGDPALGSPSSSTRGWLPFVLSGLAALLLVAAVLFFVGVSANLDSNNNQDTSSRQTPDSSPRDLGTPTDSPSPTPTSDASATVSTPRAAGTYSGIFVVTEDSDRCGEDDACEEIESLVGTEFERGVTLDADCDSGSELCTIGHLSLSVYDAVAADETDQRQWQWEEVTEDSQLATFTETWVDDCVEPGTGEVVGDFDTTVTYSILLTDPVDEAGQLVWSTALFTYVEDSISDDNEVGCYNSRYAAEGELFRD